MGFVDLHAHILPGLDDGPETMGESLAMARLAGQDGTEIILATPHQRDVMLDSSIQTVQNLMTQLNEALDEEAGPGGRPLRVLLGMENHIEPELPEWAGNGTALTINGTRFILCEPPYTTYPPYADEVLFRLQLMRLVPVIAHPERNSVLRENHKRLKALVERGMLVQLSAGSFTGEYGPQAQRAAESLLKRGLVHAVASDMHGSTGLRSPVLSVAYERVVHLAGEAQAFRLFDQTPRAIVQGREPRGERADRSSPRRWSPPGLFRRT